MHRRARVLIVSGPSGAGKGTLIEGLLRRFSFLTVAVSATTRPQRPGEVDGREYHFVSRETFEQLIQLDEFLEWAEVHGNLYGTSRREVTSAGDKRGIIFDIDHQGARQIKSVHPGAISVFILPPSMEVLEARLRGRASEDEPTVQRRFAVAREEIAHYGQFDYLLVNDDLEQATLQLSSIFLAAECARARRAAEAEHLLAEGRGFGGSKPPAA